MEEYMSPAAVAEMIPGITETGLAQLRWRGDGPPFIKPSPKKVVYRRSDVEAWLESRVQTSTREAVGA